MCVVGRRYRERRASEQPFAAERRRADRRRLKGAARQSNTFRPNQMAWSDGSGCPQIASLFFQENLANGLLPH